jgi:hypothetical protein
LTRHLDTQTCMHAGIVACNLSTNRCPAAAAATMLGMSQQCLAHPCNSLLQDEAVVAPELSGRQPMRWHAQPRQASATYRSDQAHAYRSSTYDATVSKCNQVSAAWKASRQTQHQSHFSSASVRCSDRSCVGVLYTTQHNPAIRAAPAPPRHAELLTCKQFSITL